ncbi:MAG TPA: YxeA family protein [Bacillota bacterium]|nr:YxeA family protein [Bacillota bacterium]
MNKKFIIVMSIAVLFIGAIIAFITIDFNRLGKEHVYYEITDPSDVEETTVDNGEVIERYVYKGIAYTDSNDEKSIEFSAAKELKQGAYLKIYLDKEGEVTSYDEVSEDELPDDLKQ